MREINFFWRFVPFALLFLECNSYKILAFFPFPSNSHHNIFFGLIRLLADRGHEITYYTPIEPTVSHPNIKLKLTPNYKTEFLTRMDIVKLGQISVPEISNVLAETSEDFAEHYYGNSLAQEIIHSSENYDAVLMESYFCQEPVSALIHKFGCVGIEISTMGDSAWISEWAGLPFNAGNQVDFKVEMDPDMTLLEKLYNVYAIGSTLMVSYFHNYRMKAIMDKYFRYEGWETRPPLETMLANRSMILINSDPVLSYPYPTPPHVKDIAGMNLVQNQPLPKDLQKFMDESEHGVVYFSFGSNLNTSDMMRGEVGQSFMNAFRKLPQRVLMKWETNNREIKIPPNVKTGKWFPQSDILAHKNCRLFITHGGFLSITETIHYGVPIVGVPFFSDQYKNMRHAERMGYGLTIKYGNITEASLSWAFNEVINNPKYRKEAERRSRMFQDKRHTAQEEAVYWTEHAIKYPNSLTPRSAFMSFWEKRVFDPGTFIILSLFISYVFLTLFIYRGKKKFSSSRKLKMS